MANITHELKTPLAAIQLHTQTLQNQNPDPSQNESLNYILEQTKRMNHLVLDLLEATRLEQKKPIQDLTLINLKDFSDHFFPEITTRLKQQNYQLNLKINTTATILGKVSYLERILNNLVENAVKANPNKKTILIQIIDQSSKVILTVQDPAENPIPKNEQKKIFDRFYQTGKEIRNERKGAGLGLFIVKELVESLSGKIQLKCSTNNTGTCFEVQLPKAKV